MADRHFRSLFRALHLRREQWTFLLMALLCVSVIVGTALWTRQAEFARVTPTPPISGDISAAQLLQQQAQVKAADGPCLAGASRGLDQAHTAQRHFEDV